MIRTAFNTDWTCWRADGSAPPFLVRIPHDAMLLDERSDTSAGGTNTGWYEAKDYTYEKRFFVPREWKEQIILFEFEGVYHKAAVYINGVKAAYEEYGYNGFYIPAGRLLRFGEENTVRVEAVNHDQPNSRWYTGTGIYRPVWLLRFPKKHIAAGSIRISTVDYTERKIRISAILSDPAAGCSSAAHEDIWRVKVEILDRNQVIASEESAAGAAVKDGRAKLDIVMSVPGAQLWSDEHPRLYRCRMTFGDDVQTETFGIRQVECSPETGFCINGERVILRGACVHHDNGLLGACAYDFAEYRKAELLKKGGYNAVRSAHNPCSKAFLKACDEIGLYVMDEYVDHWYIHKTKYDYADSVPEKYRKDLARMVKKDFNHPSVVMYSTGNEVTETGEKRGIALCGKMTEALHEFDGTRPVTCGINIFFNFLYSLGFGVYSDKKAEDAMRDARKKKAVGSEFFNTLAGIAGADFMKTGATLPPCDYKTRDAFARMDVAGYNYGIKRYRHDLKKYPDRLIVGSETFCADAFRFWEEAKRNHRLIGDFVWAGMDYLGETGIGAWEYSEYAPDFKHGNGWLSAGSGRIDLTGKELGEMQYTKVAFEQIPIAMAVIPVPTAKDPHSPSAWKMTNAMESWSWHGCTGRETTVEVYTRGSRAALFLNGKKIGEKPVKGDCRVTFKAVYDDGELIAVSYDEKGQEIAETSLKTAGEETRLTLEPERTEVNLDGDLCYIRMKYTDEAGIVKPMLRGRISVDVTNGQILGIGSANPYNPDGFLGNTTDTYYGEAMVIVRPENPGDLEIRAKSPFGGACAVIKVTEQEL